MKSLILIVLIAIAFNVETARANNLRGQVVRNTGQYQPVAGLRVDLMIWNGASWVDSSYAITGNDGFYFFLNLSYPVGTKFCINIAGRYYPLNTIQATQPGGYQNLAVIVT